MRIGLAKTSSLLRDMHFVQSEALSMQANDLPKLNNAKQVCVINMNMTLYYVFSLNICEYYEYQ